MIGVVLSAEHRGLRAAFGERRCAGALKLFSASLGLLALAACGQQNAFVPPPPPKVIIAQPLQQDVPLYRGTHGQYQGVQ